jgi:hypothetical protein
VEDVIGQDELVLAHRAHMAVEEVRALQRSLRLSYAAAPVPAALLLQQAHQRQPALPLSVGLTAYASVPCIARTHALALTLTLTLVIVSLCDRLRLDELLGGGLRAGEVTEVVGGAASGKTALCMQACASVLADPTATIAYVDSANAFTPTRLLPLLPHVRRSASCTRA